MSQPTLTFEGVGDALETFSGDGSKNFQRWVTHLEETSDLCNWTEVEKVIYRAKSWKKLKKPLKEEFLATANS